eukprot:309061_1
MLRSNLHLLKTLLRPFSSVYVVLYLSPLSVSSLWIRSQKLRLVQKERVCLTPQTTYHVLNVYDADSNPMMIVLLLYELLLVNVYDVNAAIVYVVKSVRNHQKKTSDDPPPKPTDDPAKQPSDVVELKVTEVLVEDSDSESKQEDPGPEGRGKINTTGGTEMLWEERLADHLKSHVTIREFGKKLQEEFNIRDEEDDGYLHKVKTVSQVRNYLFRKRFPLPHIYERIGWIVLILWSAAACIIAIVYGLRFDMDAHAAKNSANPHMDLYENDECWNTTLSLQIEASLSKDKFLADFAAQQYKNAMSYAGSDSMSWVLSIFQSLLQSIFLWQPLNVYLKTWVRVWLFSWNLKISSAPKNILKLVRRVCCGYQMSKSVMRLAEEIKAHEDEKEKKKPDAEKINAHEDAKEKKKPDAEEKKKADAEKMNPHDKYRVRVKEERPVDAIAFLGNDTWMIDDVTPKKAQTNKDGVQEEKKSQEETEGNPADE